MPTAVIYTRVSSADQVEGTSLDTQREVCARAAVRDGHTAGRTYVERGESAKTAARPVLLEMLADIRKGGIDRVYVYKFDRLARNAHDALGLRAECQRHGCKLVSATEPITDDPLGRFVEVLLAGMAQLDNEIRAERARRGMVAQAQRGGWVHQAPTGYRVTRVNGLPTLEPLEPAAAQVAQAFRSVAAGIRPAEAWRASGLKIGLQRFMHLIRSRVYVGEVDNRLAQVRASWPPLVDTATFAAVQSVLAGKRVRSRASQDFPARGVLMCACGKPLRGSWSTGHGGRYGYYWCEDGHERIRAERVDADLQEALAEIRAVYAPPLAKLRLLISRAWRDVHGSAVKDTAALDAQSARIRQRRERLLDLHLDGHISDEQFTVRDGQFRAELVEVTGRCHQARLEQTEAGAIIARAEQLLADLPALVAAARARNPEQARTILRALWPSGIRQGRTYASQSILSDLRAWNHTSQRMAYPAGVIDNLITALRVLVEAAA
jgi:DNA invertase Pin-like site-specific DNA recombinase